MDAKSLPWVGGQHDFVLNLGQLRAVQQTCNAGPQTVMSRIAAGAWFVDDLLETLRQGLIGGGMESKEAGPLVARMFEVHGAFALKPTAHAVLAHALIGEVDDPVGE
ncbi:hypothetical protein PsAD2_04624 [Pseudovibrio axinellae]|uniref:Gene transfer agent family protein n=1 Tax=Pseudovibrio axinellae TaxID=989403 RepID=A0A165SVU8_9HYPH|nr:gene transfer agent family protein [Pseudovibrio axinellae]KZL04541.1 hypothetical protein PsAD2_04624 [Pseudovibrio axinellae]SEQ73787.1 Phage tail tube protein, GTA-gp10 [Pseudovibrio axinellae]